VTHFLESLVRGLGTGSVYALLALGFVIIYKSTRVISFAQPSFMMAGALMVSAWHTALGFAGALAVAIVAAAAMGAVVERVTIRPMIGRPVFTIAIITLGVDVVVRTVVTAFILDERTVGDPWQLKTVTVAGLLLQQRHLVILAATGIVVTLLFLFFRYTRLGLAMRAVSLDQEAAMAQGVSVGAVFGVSWALAGALAAISGTFAAIGSTFSTTFWLLALTALPVIILGGLDSLPGAVIGGLAIGVLQELAANYQQDLQWLGPNVSELTPYVVMLLVLLFKPYGLFGTREVERV
jgi:branched-chain amino acid transport system permease protein